MYRMLNINEGLIGEVLEELDLYDENIRIIVILEEVYYEEWYITDYLLLEDITLDEIVNMFYLDENKIIKVMSLEELLCQLVIDNDNITRSIN
ncbi:hypothetical protein [Clostridium tertium]|uniref:hypothetical protein n=1 Tax=Clostridium tertium TaxID=1559 RepID=UPI000BE29FAF|nr:hypothetical protein [Clostridium tertium]